jgi:hypothetical protein
VNETTLINPLQAGTFKTLPLTVAVVFEDVATGVRARLSLDHLACRLEEPEPFRLLSWRLDLLGQRFFQKQLADPSVAVDIVLFSLHGWQPLTGAAVAWLAGWLADRRKPSCALGVLLDSVAAAQGLKNPVVRQLQQVADMARVGLFYGGSEGSTPGVSQAFGRQPMAGVLV